MLKPVLHQYDLPANHDLVGAIAVDTEAMGLLHKRDRLCVVQLCDSKQNTHIVHFPEQRYDAPNLKALLTDGNREKIFHFARFDLGIMQHYLNIKVGPVFCTKIASKLARTYTDTHGLKDLCRELLNVTLSKQQQSSDWGSDKLSKEQLEYAASDVIYLHQIRDKLTQMLKREGRFELAAECFRFLPARVALDLAGWAEKDVFAHE